MKRNEIVEETRYCWECPACGHFNEMCEDPYMDDELSCEECDHIEPLEEE